ncbi:MAG: SH3 domain-containing protein [Clostridia bacterium]|nr:SH3 domain-containing protein [Clostridia bacterium]
MITAKNTIAEARKHIGTPYGTRPGELDCINLIKLVIRSAPGGVKGYTTAGTNSLWNSYDMSAKYRDLTDRYAGIALAEPGMIAFKANGADFHHAGIVTEAGTVVHASSVYGETVETPLTAKEGWTHLAVHRHIETGDAEEETPMEENVLFRALVVTASGALNMREEPDKGAMVVEKLPKGAEVEVLEKTNLEWWRVRYKGEVGYAAEEYLSKVEESSTVTITRSAAQALYDALGAALGVQDSVD